MPVTHGVTSSSLVRTAEDPEALLRDFLFLPETDAEEQADAPLQMVGHIGTALS